MPFVLPYAASIVKLALTYHVEGPRDRPSEEIYGEICRQVELADELGWDFAWFAEHHAHIHLGHLPNPLLLALHLAGRTRRIRLGTAVICLNMHHAVQVAEDVAVADHLSGGRISPGFGSGSTREELALFDLPNVDADTRHAAFSESLRIIRGVWTGEGLTPALPRARPDLCERSWVAANSQAAATIAGAGGHNMMWSFLRRPDEYLALHRAYADAGGRRSVAANRPVYVAATDEQAWAEAEPALRLLWRRFVEEGKIPADRPEPARFDMHNAPGQFVVGSASTVARFIRDLRELVPFDTFNVEPRWAGLTSEQVEGVIRRFVTEVRPLLD